MKIVIITPIFQNMVGGAAIYYDQLSSNLAKYAEVAVISEKSQESKRTSSSIKVIDLFPEWAGRNKTFASYFKYVWQNIRYFDLIHILKELSPDYTLVHSFFYKHPGTFPWIMEKTIRRFPHTGFVLDVRDRSIASNKKKYLEQYDFLISCSENVSLHLKHTIGIQNKIEQIPVIQIPLKKLLSNINPSKKIKPFLGSNYVFYAGAIKEDKKVDVLLEAFVSTVSSKKPDVHLLLAGPLKSKSKKIRKLLDHPSVHWLGRLNRDEVICLTANAGLIVNLSPIESMSRICLEAIDLGKPVILPPNVPEYERSCPEFVVGNTDPKDIGQFMLEVMDDQKSPDYPIELHHTAAVMKRYYQVFGLKPGFQAKFD